MTEQRLYAELTGRSNHADASEAPMREEAGDPLTPAAPRAVERRCELRVNQRLYEYQWFRIDAVSGDPSRVGLVLRDVTG